ncbi:MAG: [FeFe] hydrogenase H-cluster maturation GTPase HydF [Suipraeoptans sp.]
MSLQNTPASERIHIGIFGKRNAGKSSIINAITGQDLSIVSDIKGTTTDPVLKTMELLPIGPVVIIDTPGLDDEGALGTARVKKAYQMLNKTDIALLVVDITEGMTKESYDILNHIKKKDIPYLIVYNKSDLSDYGLSTKTSKILSDSNSISVSATNKINIDKLKEAIGQLLPDASINKPIVRDLICPGDFVVLVVPIDSAAPKGRLILPQQQTIRDILEGDAISIVTKETTLDETLKNLGSAPALVITDSQAFSKVSKIVPNTVPLTSFSILFARYKGNLKTLVDGARSLDRIKDNANILICEGCTHHRQCDDIGTVKIPKWIENYTGKKHKYSFTSGTEFPLDLSEYDMIIHCGACMLNEREMKYRIGCAVDAGIPMTNYGTIIAHMNGILERTISPLK